jgi:hypothetical protein
VIGTMAQVRARSVAQVRTQYLFLVSTKKVCQNGSRTEQRAPIVLKESKGTSEGCLLTERGKPAAKVTWRDKRAAPFTC